MFSTGFADVGFHHEAVFSYITLSRIQPTFDFCPLVITHANFNWMCLVWGSNIDFNDTDRADLEVDGYAGYSYNIDQWTLDGRFTYYAYPGAKVALDYDYYEIGGSVTYDFGIPKLTGSVNYSPDYFGESGNAVYYSLSTKVPLVYGFGLNGKIGHQSIDDDVRFGYPSYTDWSAGVTYDWRGFTVGLQYVDTNIDKSRCADGCDAKGIASVTYAF